MRRANIYVHGILCGHLLATDNGQYRFEYIDDYVGDPVSLTMPLSQRAYDFDIFPPFFDGLLPEGQQLEGLLKTRKIDRHDYFSQLIAVGRDVVGAATIMPGDAP